MNSIFSLEKLLDAGPVMYPLLLCSVGVMALAIERLSVFIVFRPKQKLKQASVFLASLKEQGFEFRQEQLSLHLEGLRFKQQRRCRLLQLLGAIAPLLGLLGTVLGIITMFQEVSLHSGPVTPALLASGMWQAMSTTAIGLVVAIPALALGQGLILLSAAQLEQFALVLSKENAALNWPENTALELSSGPVRIKALKAAHD